MSKRNAEKVIHVGSRKSELALIQTKYVISRMQSLFPDRKFEIRTMSTIGDRVLNISLPKIGEKSLFTKDLEDALNNCLVDFVVHSLKDLPTSLPPGMVIGAVLSREDPGDVLVLNEKHKDYSLETLPKGSVIGTSSLRRTAQLRRLYPQLEICDIRGNLNTRLAKLDAPASKYAGIVLARAGLIRMGWKHRISQNLEPDNIMYAVGQGALAVECRQNDTEILEMLEKLICLPTICQILSERSFLKTLGGGCSAPVAVKTHLISKTQESDDKMSALKIFGGVWSLDGTVEIKGVSQCNILLKHDKEIKGDEFPTKRLKKENLPDDIVIIAQDDNDNKLQKDPILDVTAVHSELLQQCPFYSQQTKGSTDVNHLNDVIEAHTKLLQRCPFYTKHLDKFGESSIEHKDKTCPIRIPIGQDFMGNCPLILDLNAKVTAAFDHSSNKVEDELANPLALCPFFSELKKDATTTSNLKDMLEFHASSPQKCSYYAKYLETKGKAVLGEYSKESKCPVRMPVGKDFMGNCPLILDLHAKVSSTFDHNAKQFKVDNCGNIDCLDEVDKSQISTKADVIATNRDQLLSKDSNANSANETLIKDEVKNVGEPFCGLYCHNCVSPNLLDDCRKLGEDLARKLMESGALDVMNRAQSEIRGSI